MEDQSNQILRIIYVDAEFYVKCCFVDPRTARNGPPCDILPSTRLAVSCDPELAIAKAKASQDHNKHRREIGPRILILNYSQGQSGS